MEVALSRWKEQIVRKIYIFSMLLAALALSCEGPAGPAGPQGAQGAQGDTGQTGQSGQDGAPCDVADNMDGTFTMTCGTAAPVTFGETEPPASYLAADAARGGQLYDKFWNVADVTATAPTSDHPLYPSFGAKTAGDTWRCKECHGWDYLGRDGRYSSGSHYSGVRGLYPATRSHWQAFITIRDGHGYGAAGLTDADVWDLVRFYREQMIDFSTVLDRDGAFLGSASAGEAHYASGLSGFDGSGASTGTACAVCHGADGTTAVSTGFTNFPGFLSNDNPQEFFHKVRFGHPGAAAMPAAAAINTSMKDMVDLAAYAQTLAPVDWAGTDIARGAQLYDKFWNVAGVTATTPTEYHPLYPADGARAASDSWRCKECHGWDYIGAEGRYSTGSHYTGIAGLLPAYQTRWQTFETLVDHGYTDAGLVDADLWDLVAFYNGGMMDLSFVLNPDGTFRGTAAAGQTLYEGSAACAGCHGADGLTAVTTGFTNFPGFLSNDNPQEFLHKVRFGHPGSTMPAAWDAGITTQELADLATYCQTLPAN